MKKILLVTTLVTVLSTATLALAHEGEESSGAAATSIPALPAGDVMAQLDEGDKALQAAVSAKAFDKVHETIETLEPILKGLKAAHKDDAAISGTVTQVEKVLGALHEAGDVKDSATASLELKKFESGLTLLKARLPAADTTK
jgi:hypothetical protein